MTSRPDEFPGWELVEEVPARGRSFHLHLKSGSWVGDASTEGERPRWEVYTGTLDGATFPSLGLAVCAVEYAWSKRVGV